VENATAADGKRTSGGDAFIAASVNASTWRKTAGGSGAALDLDKDLASSSEARRQACVYGVKTVRKGAAAHLGAPAEVPHTRLESRSRRRWSFGIKALNR
jgi:hypothetical protein